MKRQQFLFLLIVLILVTGLYSCNEEAVNPEIKTEGRIGVLLPLTGDHPLNHESQKVSVELAVIDINADSRGSNLEIKIVDTQSRISNAISSLTEMAESGIRIVINPGTSEELDALKYVANEKGVLIINQGSTAPSLAVDDNTFRLIPDDRVLASAITMVMENDGIKHLVIMARNDIWGTGLSEQISSKLSQIGGNTFASVNYNTVKLGNDLDSMLEELNNYVSQAVANYGASSVAVELISFNEGVEILRCASSYPALSEVRWYGSDGITQNVDLTLDSEAAVFAEKTNLACPMFGGSDNEDYTKVKQSIEAETGDQVYSLAMLSYDAVRIADITLSGTDDDVSVAELKEKLTNTMNGYQGIAGPYLLNDSGDQTVPKYDFWTINNQGAGQYKWVCAFRFVDGVIQKAGAP